MKDSGLIYLCILLFAISCRQSTPNNEGPTPLAPDTPQAATPILLPTGWQLTPAGESRPLGDLPLNMVISPSQKWAAVVNNGYGPQSVMLWDVKKKELLDTAAVSMSWLGVCFSQDERHLYVSGGNENGVWRYSLEDEQLTLTDTFSLGKRWPTDRISIAGIAVDKAESFLYAVTKEDNQLYVYDLNARQIHQKLELPGEAYTCLLSPDESELYISVWGSALLLVYNVQEGRFTDEIETGSHPNDMVLTQDGQTLYVACASDNTVSVMDMKEKSVTEVLGTAIYPNSPPGSTSNGVALSQDECLLFIANADNNCLAVFDVTEPGESRSVGFIPTGWYPTVVRTTQDQIWVANGKGFTSYPNPMGPIPGDHREQYIGDLFPGSLSIIPIPTSDSLKNYTRQVYANTPYEENDEVVGKEGFENNPIPLKVGDPSPIRYVFYLIKENRTYDQVFGDIPKGNGDPSLCLFPDSVTPNHHALANTFVLLDNFYVNAEVSADGHNWSTAAYANDYVEKTWPSLYSNRGGTYDYEGEREIAYPEGGFIWNYCVRAGVSFRNYGCFSRASGPKLPVLREHSDLNFTPYDLTIRDTTRFREWKEDFDRLVAENALPRFHTIRMGNDHTSGARLGKPAPHSMMADNDLAVGMFIEHLSHSPVWKESAVFVVEDDAQAGSDHVDAHRSIALVASPYAKRNAVVHDMYSTASVLRTMELILGIPPMSQYDAGAPPMYACFTSEPDFTPYNFLPNQVSLDDLNIAENELSRISETFNLAIEDAAPDILFNQVLWKTVRGIDSEMPPPRRSAFIRQLEEDEERRGRGRGIASSYKRRYMGKIFIICWCE